MSTQRRASANIALECPSGSEYDEPTFRYFLELEQARAGRVNAPVPLLFATFEPEPGRPSKLPAASAAKLFNGLREALRDTDVMGWYRQDHVAGAVISASADDLVAGVAAVVERRVREGIRRNLPSKIADRVRVRIIETGPQPDQAEAHDLSSARVASF